MQHKTPPPQGCKQNFIGGETETYAIATSENELYPGGYFFGGVYWERDSWQCGQKPFPTANWIPYCKGCMVKAGFLW